MKRNISLLVLATIIITTGVVFGKPTAKSLPTLPEGNYTLHVNVDGSYEVSTGYVCGCSPEELAIQLQDVTARAALADAMNAAFEDATFTFHIPRQRTESISVNGDEVIGQSLVPIPEWDEQQSTLPEFLEKVRRHVNRSRTGSE